MIICQRFAIEQQRATVETNLRTNIRGSPTIQMWRSDFPLFSQISDGFFNIISILVRVRKCDHVAVASHRTWPQPFPVGDAVCVLAVPKFAHWSPIQNTGSSTLTACTDHIGRRFQTMERSVLRSRGSRRNGVQGGLVEQGAGGVADGLVPVKRCEQAN